MTKNAKAGNRFDEHILEEIRARLQRYSDHVGKDTPEDRQTAKLAKESITDWAASDLFFLLRMYDKTLARVESLEKLLHDIQSRPNCNDCGISKTCKILPDWGDPVRYNCAMWVTESVENE